MPPSRRRSDGRVPRERSRDDACRDVGSRIRQIGRRAHREELALWEVFVRGKRGLSHVHAGSLHAPDAALALRNARDVYTRRQEGVSLWVVRADDITASSPDEKDSFFDPAADKIYRHPTFYDVPDDVEYL